MSLKLCPEKAEMFKIMMDQLAAINSQINIHFRTDEGFYVQCMDQSQASLCDIKLHPDWFDNYEFEKEVVVGINLEILNKIMACRGKSQTLTMMVGQEEETDKIEIIMDEGKSPDVDKAFEMNTYFFEGELLEIPDVEADIDITVNSSLITNAIEQIAIFGETLQFQCHDDGITLVSKENKLFTTMTTMIKMDDVESYSTADEDHTEEFTMSYFVKMCGFGKVVGKAETVDIKIQKDAPIMLKYIVGDNQGSINVCLAPKIKDDDDEED